MAKPFPILIRLLIQIQKKLLFFRLQNANSGCKTPYLGIDKNELIKEVKKAKKALSNRFNSVDRFIKEIKQK